MNIESADYTVSPTIALLKWVADEIRWGHDMTASLALIEREISRIERNHP